MASVSECEQNSASTKRAVILGGSSAIGSLIVSGLAKQGVKVLFTYNRNSEIRQKWEREYSANIKGIKFDLRSQTEMESFLSSVHDFGIPDIFVNSVGVNDDCLCLSGTIAQSIRRVTEINYLVPALVSSAVGRLMAEHRSGYIVHITSTASRNPKLGNAAYGASKVALERFVSSLALELARFGVKTLCIAPSFVDTPMFATYAGENREKILRSVPTRRILQPQEVADVAIQFSMGQIATTGTTIFLGNGESLTF